MSPYRLPGRKPDEPTFIIPRPSPPRLLAGLSAKEYLVVSFVCLATVVCAYLDFTVLP